MTEPDRNIARIVAAQKKPVWLYYFSYEAPAARTAAVRGAAHGAEIAYVFQQRSPSGEDLATGQSMTAYWAAFAKYGDPGAAGGPQWDRYNAANDNLLEFSNTGPRVTTKLNEAQLNFTEQQPHT
jgi:para-nitrobenzyl esterase